jgi:hypothetical protein
MFRVIRSALFVALVLFAATRIMSTRSTTVYSPPMRSSGSGAAGTTIVVVFIPVDQTAGFFHHAFILFFRPDNLRTHNGAYKTEGLGGGSRNLIGSPALIAPRAPHAVTASTELAIASDQDCREPPYLFPPWGSCSWQDFSLAMQTRLSVEQLRTSFAHTAQCFTVHPTSYSLWGPNTNTYAFTALHNAGISPPRSSPGDVAAPGWGGTIHSACTLT